VAAVTPEFWLLVVIQNSDKLAFYTTAELTDLLIAPFKHRKVHRMTYRKVYRNFAVMRAVFTAHMHACKNVCVTEHKSISATIYENVN
jgi:hypothetical protein